MPTTATTCQRLYVTGRKGEETGYFDAEECIGVHGEQMTIIDSFDAIGMTDEQAGQVARQRGGVYFALDPALGRYARVLVWKE